MSLQINGLSFGYDPNSPVLTALSLEIEAGTRHGILGVNGAGKTTLFQVVSGWQPPSEGVVLWEGAALRREQVAMLDAEPYFYPYMTGLEYLRFLKEDAEQIERWNRLFSLPLDQLAESYSTGMKKKLAFIGVLLQETRPVLILDEPFNGVDFESNEKMMLILSQNMLSNRTILISSHILPTLMRVCDRISVLRSGNIERTFEKAEFDELETSVHLDIRNEVERSFEAF